MKRLLFITLAITLLICGCAKNRQKLSPQGNLYLKSANVYYANKNIDKAFDFYSKVLQDNPDHAQALKNTADIYLYNAEQLPEKSVEYNKKAYETYSHVIDVMSKFPELKPEEKKIILEAKRKKESAWVRIFKAGEAQNALGNTKDAIAIFEICMNLDATRVEPLAKLKDLYEKDLNNPGKTEQLLKKMITLKPNEPMLLKELGAFYFNKQDYSSALLYFEKVRSITPADMDNLLNIAFCYFETFNYSKAEEVSLDILNIQPNNIDALTNAKLIAIKLQRPDDALKYLNRIIDIDPSNKNMNELCTMLSQMKNWKELLLVSENWFNKDTTNKDAAQFAYFAASNLSRKDLEKKYLEILKKLK